MTGLSLISGGLLIATVSGSASISTNAEMLEGFRNCRAAVENVSGTNVDLVASMEHTLATFGWSRGPDRPDFHSHVYAKPGSLNTLRLPKSGQTLSCTVAISQVEVKELERVLNEIRDDFQPEKIDTEMNSYLFERSDRYVTVTYGAADEGHLWANIFVRIGPTSTLD